MKWSEMTAFRKVVFIVWMLCLIAGLTLTILDLLDILTGMDMLEDIIDCAFWLSAGIVYYKKEQLFPILCFVMAGLNLICIFI